MWGGASPDSAGTVGGGGGEWRGGDARYDTSEAKVDLGARVVPGGGGSVGCVVTLVPQRAMSGF